MLKERKTLVLVLRESPYSLVQHREHGGGHPRGRLGHARPRPSFYSKPDGTTALLDTVTARILDQLGIDNALMKRWTGRHLREESS